MKTLKRSWSIGPDDAKFLDHEHRFSRASALLFFASQGQEIVLRALAKEGVTATRIEITAIYLQEEL